MPPRDPRAEGQGTAPAERVQLPSRLSDPLGMNAGQSGRARSEPLEDDEPRYTLPPVEQRRTLPFIRGNPSVPAESPAHASPAPDSGFDGPTDPSPPPDGMPLLSGAPFGTEPLDAGPVDAGPVDAGPIDTAGSLGTGPYAGLPQSDPPHERLDIGPDWDSMRPPGASAVFLDDPADGGNPDPSSRPPAKTSLPSPTPMRPSFPQTAADLTRPLALAAELQFKAPHEAEPFIQELLVLGPEGLDAITQHFPGTLWIDRTRFRGEPPQGEGLSATAAALVRAGDAAIPHIVHLLGASDRTVRFCAALVARELNNPSVVQPLFRMLVDADGDNIDAAAIAIQQLNPEWITPRLARLRESLADPNGSPGQHLMAARTLGALRDLQAVPLLIERLNTKHADVGDAALTALDILTTQGIKKSRAKWRRWFKRHGAEPRAAWLLTGLVHSDAALRVRAFRELVMVTGKELGMHRTARKEDAVRLRDEYAELVAEKGLL